MKPSIVTMTRPGASFPPCRPAWARRSHGWAWWLAAFLLPAPAVVTSAESPPRAAVFSEALPGHDAALAKEIGALVSLSGYTVEVIGAATLTNASLLATRTTDLLVLPGARALPAVAAPAIEQFLREGGDLLALGLPAWEEALFDLMGSWVSRGRFEAIGAAQQPQHILFDFAAPDLSQWRRATDDPGTRTQHEIVAADRGKALHVIVGTLTGWDTFLSPPLTNSFPPNHTLTCFRGKGTAPTKQLALEWTERDGSRWIATVDLTTEWKSYALPPESFKAWQPPAARSGKDDGFRPENATQFVVGLAHSHTAVEGTRHEYWLADVGTASSPFGDARLPSDLRLPHLESLSPGYQFFPLAAPVKIGLTQQDETFASPTPEGLLGIHPRPRGVGFRQERGYRWEPLLTASDARDGDYRGALAALLVHAKPPFAGGVWAVFTPSEAEFYRQTVVKDCLQQTLSRLRRGAFLIEGGAEFFTTFEAQHIPLGALVANFGLVSQTNLSISIAVKPKAGGLEAWSKDLPLALAAGALQTKEDSWTPSRWPEGGFEVHTELLLDGKVADRLSHDLRVWQPKAKADFIEARDGGLWLRGKPWRVNGVNYMPSSGIGLANSRHFEHWVGRGAYDPEVIERDLRRVKAMNLNAVSVFIYHESLGAQHLLDFLRRCEALDLHVNLSLRPGTPMDFRWNEMRALIEHYRLAQNDTVFAYDLAWEPSHGGQAQQQKAYGELWPAWVERRYGGLEAAWRTWDFRPPDLGASPKSEVRSAKSLPVPPMKWLTQDGPWRRLVADYRLFLDELLGAKYAEARRLVKSVDPRHAVSFRMQHAGDPTLNWENFLPYDFPGLADAVDLWEPEAYGRIGDWEKIKPGRFTADYARLCDPAKPILWAEMGYTVWNNLRMAPAPEKLVFQARYFSDYYRLLAESGVDGVFFWWYPGGYRLNEQSDFGLLNPDGTDRPVTKVVREQGGRFLKSPKPPWNPDHWIVVDRDRDARGLFGIYEAAKTEFWQTIEEGKTPGLKWQRPPGHPEGR